MQAKELKKFDLRFSRSIYIPVAKGVMGTVRDQQEREAFIAALVDVAGGVTITPCNGYWNGQHAVMHERVEKLTVWFGTKAQRREVSALFLDYTKHLLNTGEEAVFREWSSGSQSGALVYSEGDDE
ncbi:hypothetical protein FDH29_gp15 [Aquamicrobium phage P14]|uniref:Uncharacterized protein n=1 Tax=Aquamicrobium phage P14 TaxID=1927013 RepID=A0A1L5C040_9CAUD|nr:hypothetical protein FDH29_gp15 [Aquamicrobium phage P14]APL99473.1 hypothetical protein BB738_0150 [Aquamicrobium phage P14]